MFDTHCHLNFSAFKNNLNIVIQNAEGTGVKYIVIPGTDYQSSKKAVEIAEQNEGIYAAVGIHPHHIYQYQTSNIKDQNYRSKIKNDLGEIEELLQNKKVVAVGEVGLDRHYYQKTKYRDYKVDEGFMGIQKSVFIEQMRLADKYKKSLIIHNREAKNDLLEILHSPFYILHSIPIVFHCCEPDQELLDFAIQHNIYIGVDGDVTYDTEKQEFVKKIPLELLVLETDSPFLLPQLSGSRSWSRYNEPKNLPLIAECIAKIMNVSMNRLIDTTTENAKRLFQIENL